MPVRDLLVSLMRDWRSCRLHRSIRKVVEGFSRWLDVCEGMSLLSLEIFVARDGDGSAEKRLLHTGGRPLRMGLRRVVDDSTEGGWSDEEQTAVLEIEIEVN